MSVDLEEWPGRRSGRKLSYSYVNESRGRVIQALIPATVRITV